MHTSFWGSGRYPWYVSRLTVLWSIITVSLLLISTCVCNIMKCSPPFLWFLLPHFVNKITTILWQGENELNEWLSKQQHEGNEIRAALPNVNGSNSTATMRISPFLVVKSMKQCPRKQYHCNTDLFFFTVPSRWLTSLISSFPLCKIQLFLLQSQPTIINDGDDFKVYFCSAGALIRAQC